MTNEFWPNIGLCVAFFSVKSYLTYFRGKFDRILSVKPSVEVENCMRQQKLCALFQWHAHNEANQMIPDLRPTSSGRKK